MTLAPRILHTVLRPPNLASDPSAAQMLGGEWYYNNVSKELQAFDGTAFQPMATDAVWYVTFEGPLAVATGTKRFYIGGTGTHRLISIRGHLEVPMSTAVRVDINKNGTTIHTTQSNRLSLSTTNSGIDSVPPANIEVNRFTFGDYFTFDIDNDGGGAAGLTIGMWYRRSGA